MAPRPWHYEFRGGAYDGYGFDAVDDPQPVLIVWRCNSRCEGHATFEPHNPGIVLRTAESYRRTEVDDDSRSAIYEVGESSPGPWVDERELVGVSGGLEFVGA